MQQQLWFDRLKLSVVLPVSQSCVAAAARRVRSCLTAMHESSDCSLKASPRLHHVCHLHHVCQCHLLTWLTISGVVLLIRWAQDPDKDKSMSTIGETSADPAQYE